MKITIKGKQDKFKYVGKTEDGLIIPRIGDHINLGYNPYPVVTDVYFDYDIGMVWVFVDGFIL